MFFPLAWNGNSKAGAQRQIGVSVKWPQNTPEPKLMSLTVNGIPYTCSNDDDTRFREVEKTNVEVVKGLDKDKKIDM